MRDAVRVVSALAVGVLIAVGAAACGAGGDPAAGGGDTAIVTFAGQSITKATLAHWIPIEAVLEHNLTPEQPPPPGEIPVPPAYTACIAFQMASASPATTGTPTPSTAQARQDCEQDYEQIRQHMLQLLISYQWTEAEARAHGIAISAQELQQTWARNKLELFGGEAAFQKYLKATGETAADEMKVIRFNMQALDLREKILHEHGIPGLRRFYEQFPRELAAKTNCLPGYVIAECRQYKGRQAPEG